MPRPYGQKFLYALSKTELDMLGIELAKVCVKANLPATYVAAALETTRTTIFNWFRGQGIRESKRKTVENFIEMVNRDLQDNILPAKTYLEARKYIENIIGVSI